MLPKNLVEQIISDDLRFKELGSESFVLSKYNPKTHYLELTHSGYFRSLIVLRHYIKVTSDYYFGVRCGAKNVDLFMLTSSVSSPVGSGSDSIAIPIKFGKYNSNLVDSSQFGFEPLLFNGIDKVYCYLPSMRGESPDKRHLNQFFHCEAEIKGNIDDLTPIIEGYVKSLSETLLTMTNILARISLEPEKTSMSLHKITKSQKFPEITFDEAVSALVKSGNKHLVNFTKFGRDLTPAGELKLAKILKLHIPFWIKNYDRDRAAFYQKPMSNNLDKVLNADLIFPPISEKSFGGEIVGCGQRQDNPEEIYNSLARQNIDPKPYKWYINLRKLPRYQTTSGFGLGIERFITWSLCRDNIKDAILYPRLKNIKTCP
ncbi:MAG: hypothetical protein PHV43_01510 [Candidatus Colwellbacteria bacterium]|nr:hypothetical protein [Candidatus Colwellbacteria bacterium]